MQHRLTLGPLLNEKGGLCEAGYATSLVKAYDRRAVKAGKGRVKEWDYYLIYNSQIAVALTVDDNGYMGLLSASFLSFTGEPFEKTVSKMFFFPMGKTDLPASSACGDTEKAINGALFSFRHQEGKRRLIARMEDFSAKGQPFFCDLTLSDEPRDSMVIATPFPGDPKAFYYNQKIVAMRAEGSLTYGGKEYVFSPENSFGLLDWGRGVWTYKNTWYWSAAQGLAGDKRIGFNLGYGFGDTAAASENMLFTDGIAHKIGRVTFHIPEKDGKEDYLSPWRFTSNDGRFEATFTPLIDRHANTDFKVLCSRQHQVFGFFNGQMTLDDGTKLPLNNLLGFAEKVFNKW